MSEQETTADSAADDRLEWLRKSAAEGQPGAVDSAWSWIVELSTLADNNADAAEAQLNDLFRLGTPPVDLDGPTEGILVMMTTNPALDTVTRAVTALWMPWQGKRFDSDSGTGDNRLTRSTGLVGKLLWPLYSMRDAESGKLAFDFATYVEAGKDDPDRQVMVIDYANVESNPRLVIRSIRDELVELVPGVYLGKILFNTGADRFSKIGYFALRTPR
ncbi:hypothetical protein SBE55_01555 [Mycolicibacterium sp. 141076]|uniref:hypothetical protein n=1 Tax=Mycobacteriaceae TaxID=1762 RepID=UPI00299EDB36|nr:hypothetical protein [Mycolicibacterium sp. 141076]MDX1876494.1 hypothetical protein [Mycolicibacterium sp. 141076]